jgi:hypothetical protein
MAPASGGRGLQRPARHRATVLGAAALLLVLGSLSILSLNHSVSLRTHHHLSMDGRRPVQAQGTSLMRSAQQLTAIVDALPPASGELQGVQGSACRQRMAGHGSCLAGGLGSRGAGGQGRGAGKGGRAGGPGRGLVARRSMHGAHPGYRRFIPAPPCFYLFLPCPYFLGLAGRRRGARDQHHPTPPVFFNTTTILSGAGWQETRSTRSTPPNTTGVFQHHHHTFWGWLAGDEEHEMPSHRGPPAPRLLREALGHDAAALRNAPLKAPAAQGKVTVAQSLGLAGETWHCLGAIPQGGSPGPGRQLRAARGHTQVHPGPANARPPAGPGQEGQALRCPTPPVFFNTTTSPKTFYRSLSIIIIIYHYHYNYNYYYYNYFQHHQSATFTPQWPGPSSRRPAPRCPRTCARPPPLRPS